MERKIEVKKGNISKNIEVNLLSEYLHLGWTRVDEMKEDNSKSYAKYKNIKRQVIEDEEE